MRSIALATALSALSMLLAALLAAAPHAAADAIDPDAARLTLGLREGGDAALLLVEQRWEGEGARAFRQSLDVHFGAADGVLTEDELARIAEATRQDMLERPLPWITSGGEPALVAAATVSFVDAAGRTTSTAPVSMHHDLQLRLADAAPSAGPAEVALHPPWPAALEVRPPAGWALAEELPAILPADGATTLRFVPASSPLDAADPLVVGVMVGVVAVVALAAAALAVLRRKRRVRIRAGG